MEDIADVNNKTCTDTLSIFDKLFLYTLTGFIASAPAATIAFYQVKKFF